MMYGAIIDRVIGEKAAKHVGLKQQNKIAESKVTSDFFLVILQTKHEHQ